MAHLTEIRIATAAAACQSAAQDRDGPGVLSDHRGILSMDGFKEGMFCSSLHSPVHIEWI